MKECFFREIRVLPYGDNFMTGNLQTALALFKVFLIKLFSRFLNIGTDIA